ncbi:MAG: hypothetical protein V1816_01090 [Pseudomonadota bacterium]
MSNLDAMTNAQKLPSGARFYRCALQVNPFEYLGRHNKPTAFSNEADYNAAIIDACRGIGVEAIGITDHYRVRSAQSLLEAAQGADSKASEGRYLKGSIKDEHAKPQRG